MIDIQSKLEEELLKSNAKEEKFDEFFDSQLFFIKNNSMEELVKEINLLRKQLKVDKKIWPTILGLEENSTHV